MNHLLSSLLVIVILLVMCVAAQHHEQADKQLLGPVDLGSIDFPTSGAPGAQKHFIEGVLLLHSFEYARARRAFLEAQRIAPDFAMAYWGDAMTYTHPIWGEYDRAGALAALGRLAATSAERRAKAPTEREKLFLDAIGKLYGSGDMLQSAAEYSVAMSELSQRFPADLEAQAFYSLSLLGLTGTERNTENYMRAAAVAEAIYQKNPRHPGALHYLIHAYDDPIHAHLGLRAARVYGSVARSASHAQHMPSHIFFALGMWDDSIAANTASMKTARDEKAGGYHPLHWLIHAYVQIGRESEAAKLLDVIEADAKTNQTPYTRTHLAMCRATMIVETRGNAPASAMIQVDSTGIRAINAFANHDLAIGLEYVRRNELGEARRTLESLRRRSAAAKKVLFSEANGDASRYSKVTQSDIDTATVLEEILGAWIDFASGNRDDGIKRISAAANTEDKLIFEYGPPAIVKPAWEALGDMLLGAGRSAKAADAFRRALKRYPNRRLSNEGLKRALAK